MAVSTNEKSTSAPTIPASQGYFAPSAYNNIDKTTYDVVKSIVQNKGLYNDSRYIRGEDTYGTFQTNAAPIYEQLRAAGRGDIADGLQGSDYQSAVSYLNSIGVYITPDASTGIMDSINNTINAGSGSQVDTGKYINDYGQLANQLNGALGTAPNNNAGGIYIDANGFIQKGSNSAINTGQFMSEAEQLTKMFNDMMSGNANFNTSQGQFNQSINDMMNRYLNNDAATQGRIEDLWGQMNKYGVDQTGRYDNAANYIQNTNYLDTPASQAIQAMYAQRGADAARNAVAAGGGGNIDSFATANANRQDLTFKNAANEAMLNQWNANIGNLLNTYGALGNDMNNLQRNQIGLIGQEQGYNLGTQGNILDSQIANNQINANMNMGNADALAHSINTLGNLYQTQSNNASADYASGIGGYANMYGNAVNADAVNYATRADALSNALNNLTGLNMNNSNNASMDFANTLNALGGAYGTTYQSDTDKYIAQLNAGTNNYAVNKNYELQKYIVDNDATIQRYLGDLNAQLTREGISAEERMHAQSIAAQQIANELQYKLGLDGNQAKILAEQISANAEVTKSANQLEGTKYSADKSYDSTVYSADRKVEEALGVNPPNTTTYSENQLTSIYNDLTTNGTTKSNPYGYKPGEAWSHADAIEYMAKEIPDRSSFIKGEFAKRYASNNNSTNIIPFANLEEWLKHFSVQN